MIVAVVSAVLVFLAVYFVVYRNQKDKKYKQFSSEWISKQISEKYQITENDELFAAEENRTLIFDKHRKNLIVTIRLSDSELSLFEIPLALVERYYEATVVTGIISRNQVVIHTRCKHFEKLTTLPLPPVSSANLISILDSVTPSGSLEGLAKELMVLEPNRIFAPQSSDCDFSKEREFSAALGIGASAVTFVLLGAWQPFQRIDTWDAAAELANQRTEEFCYEAKRKAFESIHNGFVGNEGTVYGSMFFNAFQSALMERGSAGRARAKVEVEYSSSMFYRSDFACQVVRVGDSALIELEVTPEFAERPSGGLVPIPNPVYLRLGGNVDVNRISFNEFFKSKIDNGRVCLYGISQDGTCTQT